MDEETQGHPSDDLSEDDIAAALGYATTLSEPLLPQDQMDDAQDEGVEGDGESGATEQEVGDEPAGEAEMKNDRILSEIEGLRDELKIIVAPKGVEQEVADIRKELEALKNEPNREDTSTGE